MDKKALIFLVICLITLLSSYIISFLNPMPNFIGQYPLITIILICFFFGTIFFGFVSFIPHALIGLALGAKKNSIIFLYIIPIILATYAGLKLGSILFDDFNRKKYFLQEGKNILALLLGAIILALVIEIALPLILEMQLWPQDSFGMTLEKPENVTKALEVLKESLLK
ncbi:MAG: hypothetical protein PHX27_02085 [Candidatus ainarchaeum sp.]|nr:hypothetical protein [Candidatus ainarchaeum sp.]